MKAFQKLAIEERLLLISANFQSVKFIGVSVRESIIKGLKLKDDETWDDLPYQEFVYIDEHGVSLTTTGEDRLRQLIPSLKPVDKEQLKPKVKIRETKPQDESEESEIVISPRRNENVYELIESIKLVFRERGHGITPNDKESVTEQFNQMCISLLGASLEDANKAYLALRNDPQVIKISFKEGDGSRTKVIYLGLLEHEDDPLTRAQHAVNNLRDMLDGYLYLLRDNCMALDPKIREYKALCEKMSKTDWVKHEYEYLEQYTASLMQALSYIATESRSLKTSRAAI